MSRIILILLGILSGIIVLELLLRIMGPGADPKIYSQWSSEDSKLIHIKSLNPNLSYELKPNFKRPHDKFFPEIKTNSHGFRDYEYSLERSPDTYRILAIGDSVTFGWDLTLEQTYPKQLEKLLNKNHNRKIEVLNMGIGGYDSKQEAELIISKAVAFNPNLIIIGYILNDAERYADNFLLWHFSSSGSQAIDTIRFLFSQFYYTYFADLTAQSFARLSKEINHTELKILVTVFPILRHDSNGKYPFTYRHDEIGKLSKSNGLLFLDLTSSFESVGFEKLKSNDDIHPNQLGHEIAAKELASYLEKNFSDEMH